MFETAVVRAQTQAAPRRVGMLSASIAVHTFAGAAIIIASLHSLQFPQNAPRQMAEFRIPVITPPFQQGDEHGGRLEHPKTQQPAAAPKVQTAPADTAPQTMPQQTATAVDPNANASTTLSDAGPADGPIGNGKPIGDPNGVPGGLPLVPQVAQATPPPDIVYPASQVTPPVVLTRISPDYPRIAMTARRSGFAIVECVIDKSGHIRDAHVVGSSWEPFEKPALDAVQQWIFKPGILNGQAVNTLFELKVTFTLH